MTARITEGGYSSDFEEVKAWMIRYIATPYVGYPAYDAYVGSPGVELGEVDLLAPALLNSLHPPIIAFNTFQSIRDDLN